MKLAHCSYQKFLIMAMLLKPFKRFALHQQAVYFRLLARLVHVAPFNKNFVAIAFEATCCNVVRIHFFNASCNTTL